MKNPLLTRKGLLNAAFFGSFGIWHAFRNKTNLIFPDRNPDFSFLRPPGTEDESEFLRKCIRCRTCGSVCAAGCIRFFSASESPALAGTPYIIPRLRSCNLCTNCGHVCPTGALKPNKKNIKYLAEHVRMGIAVVIESNCLSFNGRVCGICHDACPVKGTAIKLKPVAKPVVDEDACIGCGRCEERCPQLPAAIIVRREETSHA